VVTITVNFSAVLTPNTVFPDSVQIRRADAGGAKTVIATIPYTNLVTQNAFTDAGNVSHCYDAVGIKAGAQPSAPSSEACWTTPALSPVNVTQPGGLTLSAISSSAIRITWDDTPDETAYEVWGRTAKGNQKFTLVASLPADSTTYDWTGRKNYTSYCAEVRGKIGQSIGPFSIYGCATTSK
jgi:hypothetical protein